LIIPAGTLVLVADGRKALLLTNRGDAAYPNLRLEETIENAANPPNRAQGTDRPGRTFQSVGQARSAMETTDLHEISEVAFAKQAARMLVRLANSRSSAKIVVVAPPRTLAELRTALSGVEARIIAEVAKDLTNHPIAKIETALRTE
jgi:protein required for attachment to host cells